MRKFLLINIVFIAIISSIGCSEKFNVAAPYKSIAVVWGFLDESDSLGNHYVRIEKAFLDQNKNALVMAQVADSSYFPNLKVKMELVNFMGATDNVLDSIPLTLVDLDTLGMPKQTGIFANYPNLAYRFNYPISSNYQYIPVSYRLIITNPATGITDSVETPVIDTTSATFAVPLFANTSTPSFDFASTNVNSFSDISIDYNVPSSYNYYNLFACPVAIAQLMIQFNWDDSNVITQVKTPHSYTYDFGYQNVSNEFGSSTLGQAVYQIYNTQMYNAVADALGSAPPNIARLMDVCKFYIYLSTSDYNNYQLAEQSQGTGLTGNEIEPIYTNIKGANVLGLYTARAERSANVTIDPNTIDSLMSSSLLSSANIVGTVYH